eukprot:scaffold138228_cov332-Phaeocystis_antarctica.AAC.1
MLCDWRACGYKQSYIRKNTESVAVVTKAGALRDTSAWRRAVGSALPLALSASTVGVACRCP